MVCPHWDTPADKIGRDPLNTAETCAPRCWPNQDSARREEGEASFYDEKGRQLRRPFRASVFNASRDDDRATIRSDGRDRPDGPTHDHGRPLQGRLNSHAP
jgi:hypothetical protein